MLWTRKYTPTTLDNVVGNDNIVNILKKYEKECPPNMLFTGPSGTCKSTCAKCMIRGYLGVRLKTHLLIIDGSINRGKGMVSDTTTSTDHNVNIIIFAKQQRSKDRSKIVLFYNFDSITSDAQIALRSVMEDYKNIRFVLLCGNIDNVKEAILSRTVIFSFGYMSNESMHIALTSIIQSEQMADICTPNLVNLIISASNGDIKRAVNYLECFCRGNPGSLSNSNETVFYRLFDIPQLELLEKFVNQILGRNKIGAFETLRFLVDESHFNLFDVVGQLFNVIIAIPDKMISVRLMKPLVICMTKLEEESSSLYMYDMLYMMFKSLTSDMTFLRG